MKSFLRQAKWLWLENINFLMSQFEAYPLNNCCYLDIAKIILYIILLWCHCWTKWLLTCFCLKCRFGNECDTILALSSRPTHTRSYTARIFKCMANNNEKVLIVQHSIYLIAWNFMKTFCTKMELFVFIFVFICEVWIF